MARGKRGRDPRAWAEMILSEPDSPTRAGQRLQRNLREEAREVLAGLTPKDEPWRPYYDSRAEYMAARKESREWSREHSQQPMSRWHPEYGPYKTKTYEDAYLLDLDWRQKGLNRGTPWHRFYVTQILREMTEEEYDAAYPGSYD